MRNEKKEDKLISLFKNINRNYYFNQNSLCEDDFEDANKQFEHFFELGEKYDLMSDFSLIEQRSLHSMSILYLGLLIKEKYNFQLEIGIKNIIFPFRYFWSILCFYHDVGYSLESDDQESINSIFSKNEKKYRKTKYYNSSLIKNKLKLNYVYYSNYLSNYHIALINNQIDKIREEVEKHLGKDPFSLYRINYSYLDNSYKLKINGMYISNPQYGKKIINQYFEYRLNEFNCLDHGICGGYILFDRFVELYLKYYKEQKSVDSQVDFCHFWYNDRFVCIEQFLLFAYLADCIASHNVFFPTASTLPIYRTYHIETLAKKRISFKSNPILFLLCFVDTIDPIKYFCKKQNGNYSVHSILNSVCIIFDDNLMRVELAIDSSISFDDFCKYLESIYHNVDFMNLKCTLNEDSICFDLKNISKEVML